MTHRSSYLAGFQAARQLIAEYAMERARLSVEAADRYCLDASPLVRTSFATVERMAAAEAAAIACFAEQLKPPPRQRKRSAVEDAARESA